MSVDTAARGHAPQASGAPLDNGNEVDGTKVSLSYKHDGTGPSPVLHMPYESMKLYSFKPRKWLLFVATSICGVGGTLRFLNGMRDFTEQEMDEDVSPGDHYVFCCEGAPRFLDRMMRSTSHSQSSVSSRFNVQADELKQFYGGCPFSRVEWDLCDVCHLVPRDKGDDYLHRVLAARGEPDDTMTIDDFQNLIVMDPTLHRACDRKYIAFLKTPNKILSTNEVPGGEDAEPDDHRVTLHCFRGRRDKLLHGAQSDLTRGAGLEDPPLQREVVQEYRPKDVLLDLIYSVTVLDCFGNPAMEKTLKEKAEEDYYPGGLVRRGEDREGKEEMQERKRQGEKAKGGRNKRARQGRTGGNSGGQVDENEKEFDTWDLLLTATYMFRGIRPGEIEAEQERRERETEEYKAQRCAGWREAIDDSHLDECVRDTEPDAHDGSDEKPVSMEEALSRSPPSYSIPPPMTYSSSTASDDPTDVSASESHDGDVRRIGIALQGDKRHASFDLNVGENTPDIEEARKRSPRMTDDENILALTHA